MEEYGAERNSKRSRRLISTSIDTDWIRSTFAAPSRFSCFYRYQSEGIFLVFYMSELLRFLLPG